MVWVHRMAMRMTTALVYNGKIFILRLLKNFETFHTPGLTISLLKSVPEPNRRSKINGDGLTTSLTASTEWFRYEYHVYSSLVRNTIYP